MQKTEEQILEQQIKNGEFIKTAIEICKRDNTKENRLRMTMLLRDSLVWVPCNAIFSDADNEEMSKAVLEAQENGELESLEGNYFVCRDEVRMVPDILQNGDDFFFPVFSSEAEMGEYGEGFSRIQSHFLEAVTLANNNEMNVKGIVINAFSDPFVVPIEICNIIAKLKSRLEGGEDE